MADHSPLPVSGYKAQSAENVDFVNGIKHAEEELLRKLDDMRSCAGIDQRWLQTGRTHIEQGFMAIVRSVFQPGRIALPGDGQPLTP